jgi:DNA-binding NarL/FixJ family response regulator
MGTITSLSPVNAAENGSADVKAKPQQQQSTTKASDTVHLTEAQQVYQLYNQGMQVKQIASSLSLSVAAVNSYLNILSGS